MLLLLLFCLSSASHIRSQPLVDLALDLETTILNTRIPDTKAFHTTYDFIIIGAGSGGAVIANRLSEIKNATVLLLEAGDQETLLSDVPVMAALTQITRYNWGYKSDPVENACKGLKGGVCNWPKGRGLGGTSLINYMLYTRGHRKDYDNWSQLGNTGWSYEEVLPYFKKSERIGIPELRDSVYHGREGTLDVQYAGYTSNLLRAFLKSSNELGYNITDPNGENLMGFSRSQATIRNGRRCSTAKAFIRPAAGRPNLHISMRSWVTKIVIDPKTKQAIGVEFMKNKKKQVVYVRKEVILSAGSISSPQLLMLSGVGPAEHLAEFEIPVIQDLKVGYNLQDHVTLNGLVFITNGTALSDKALMNPSDMMQYILQGKGPYTIPGGAEAFAFVRTEHSTFDNDYPDMEIVLGAGSLGGDTMGAMRDLLGITDEFYEKVYGDIVHKKTFGMVPVLLRPKSRGRVSLRSRNPFHWPKMQPNFMEHEDDVRAMIDGIKMTLKIGQTKSMRKFGSEFHTKPFLGCENETFNSEAYWRCCLRLYGTSLQHQSGTCKMGPAWDNDAVVDPELRVKRIRGLRVADASIIPVIPAGHTNAIVIMIAEKAADMIKQSWNLI
ncbi:glucose dehydrogenase [FAD, quinone] [Eupeodes corollae]|uniref:glucose dehydrogenase [FAD, quinone] n=1 Tax=Eupeodes corollae TaxID=290404 RepID=UPI002492C243|nr:glucose dehydrogenase [FAD, quinone] [Eupeodes corollae]XP_055907265.1 glucose dehydrogenase [FAD, quinone] [Eupeodes corollae]